MLDCEAPVRRDFATVLAGGPPRRRVVQGDERLVRPHHHGMPAATTYRGHGAWRIKRAPPQTGGLDWGYPR
jgi:hypothetical protein